MRPDIASQTRWRMGGRGVVIPLTLRAGDHPTITPEGVEPATIPLTSRIPGLLILTYYDSTSTLSYSELAIAVFARSRGRRLGLYCTHAWVDSQDSIEAGRELWQLPKQPAVFDWQKERSAWAVRVSREGADLITVSLEAPRTGFSLPVSMRCFSMGSGGETHVWTVRSRSVLGRCAVSTSVPNGSPLAGIVRRPRSGVMLDPLDLAITVPRGRRA